LLPSIKTIALCFFKQYTENKRNLPLPEGKGREIIQ